jgi:hypothetical protein
MEVIKNFRFVKIAEKKETEQLTAEQQEFVDGIKEALDQVELHLQGKIKLQTAKEFLDEL